MDSPKKMTSVPPHIAAMAATRDMATRKTPEKPWWAVGEAWLAVGAGAVLPFAVPGGAAT